MAMRASQNSQGRTPLASSLSAALYNPARLSAVRATGLLGAGENPALSRLANAARCALASPVAVITVLDASRHWVVGQSGLPAEAPRSMPFRSSIMPDQVMAGSPVVLEDALRAPTSAALQAFVDSGQRAFAAVPLISRSGHVLGSLWVADTVPRSWSAEELKLLGDLAVGAVAELDSRIAHQALAVRDTPPRGVPLMYA
jgi:GAF domain-containing protein